MRAANLALDPHHQYVQTRSCCRGQTGVWIPSAKVACKQSFSKERVRTLMLLSHIWYAEAYTATRMCLMTANCAAPKGKSMPGRGAPGSTKTWALVGAEAGIDCKRSSAASCSRADTTKLPLLNPAMMAPFASLSLPSPLQPASCAADSSCCSSFEAQRRPRSCCHKGRPVASLRRNGAVR